MSALSHGAFRLGMAAFAALLCLQSIWVLLAEFSRPGIDRLPTEAPTAAAAVERRGDAIWAAHIGIFRGDLWAEAAFTYANFLWSPANNDRNLAQTLQPPSVFLDRALDDAPHQSGAWLLLAGLGSRFALPNIDAAQALKMSYYTGPSELALAPLRLRVASSFDKFSDVELQQFIGRDLRLVLANHQSTAIADAYANASSGGKAFIEKTVGEVDPSALGSLHVPQR
jgi:hypothetical protein